jgi:CheY-like chemotaxis protein
MGDERPRILVVDDDPQVLKLFGTILRKGPYSVILLSGGDRVIPTLRESRFDLLVMDLSMPEPDGFDLLKRLRSEMPGLRILVVSGYLGGRLLKAAELLGAASTLSKTEAPAKLLDTVERLLGKYPRAE